MTNKQIAAELFLSEKTIESHLRNIFVKLGASSRVEVARAIERERREQEPAQSRPGPLRSDADAARLRELGYSQELDRKLGVLDNAAVGFAAISPVVGLYAVVFVGTTVAGPAWVWVLPVALAGQCLLIAVYSELASEFPIAGGAYQWSRRLVGGGVRLDGRLGGDLRVRARRTPRSPTSARRGRSRCSGSSPRPRRSCSRGWSWCSSARWWAR